MTNALKVAIAGLGTVGAGVVGELNENHGLISDRCPRGIEIAAVSARDKFKDRGVDIGAYRWFDDARDMARSEGIDVFVELIGGSEGIAKEACREALASGKSVVTANKALIAHHGTELATLAEKNNVSLCFEAAVAGGIPIVKAIRESLGGNGMNRVYGILNGTCNYILTAMRETGRAFEDVLAEAQNLGYAEADPTFDIEGVDTAHKLAILASVAFGTAVDFNNVKTEGIANVSKDDIVFAEKLGYRIKLLGIARMTETNLEQCVHPAMVPLEDPIAHVEDVFNAVVVDGDYVDTLMFEGRGAGEKPTASAVVGDLTDLARGLDAPSFSVPVAKLKAPRPAREEDFISAFYVRLKVEDRPGVFADIATALKNHDVSMESVLQHGPAPNNAVTVAMTLHDAREGSVAAALREIATLGSVLEEPHLIRIERFAASARIPRIE